MSTKSSFLGFLFFGVSKKYCLSCSICRKNADWNRIIINFLQPNTQTDAYVTAIKILSPSLLTCNSASSSEVMRTRFRIWLTMEPYYWGEMNCPARKKTAAHTKALFCNMLQQKGCKLSRI